MFRFKLRRRKLRVVFLEYSMEIMRYNGSDIPYKKIRKLLNKLEVLLRRHKYKEALGDFQEYINDQSYNYQCNKDFDSLEEAKKAQEFNQEYANKGIICKEDKDNLLEIIHLFRYYLKINWIV